MEIQRQRQARRWSSRWASLLGAVALVTSLAACSSGPQGVVVNLYGGASATKFSEIIDDCNAKAAGRYTIVGNLLPSDADGQRKQLVRRLAARERPSSPRRAGSGS
jgi:multiple sugar transport system substrate-binding protein